MSIVMNILMLVLVPSHFLSLLLQVAIPLEASALWPWNNDDVVHSKIKPRITRPSGPTNVSLFVVSRTELGVSWDPPLFDGGKAISKYLVEWDTDKIMTGGTVSADNPYGNSIDGPLIRSEVVWDKTELRISQLHEGQIYYVRVSAYGDSYSNAISTNPAYAIPNGVLPGLPTDTSVSIASDSETADRLRIAWSAAEVDSNGFSVLPAGCASGENPPSSPDALRAYRIEWDTHPSFSNAKSYDAPAFSGDGLQERCCPSTPNGACHIEIGTEVQKISIIHPTSSVHPDENLFDSGGIRIAYIGPQSKSIKLMTPDHESTQVQIHPSSQLPLISPIKAGDIIRIQNGTYLVSGVQGWPEFITLSTEYSSSGARAMLVQAYFSTPPTTCFDVSGLGNTAEKFRTHISQNFDNSPFDESITVSRSILTDSFEGSGSAESRLFGYEYHVTFTGQGFSSTVGYPVDELMIISKPESPFVDVGRCNLPFVSSGVDVTNLISLRLSTQMESGSVIPGQRYYARVAGVNTIGVGPFIVVSEAETPRSLSGLAQNCRVYAVPTSSSSLKVEWDGVRPYHGQIPSVYRIEFYDFDETASGPIAMETYSIINENSRYSIVKTGLTPGLRYKMLVVAINEVGEGGPSWFADFNPSGLINDDKYASTPNYMEKACHAVPTCEIGSLECHEDESASFAIVARSVPPSPNIEVGTYPSVSNRNRFSAESILVTFDSPLTDTSFGNTGMKTDKFRVEWSTNSSFRRSTTDGLASFWTTEVVASYSKGDFEHAFGEFIIDSLDMGMQYFVHVVAHNSAGFGPSSTDILAKPMTRPDPPYDPVLSSVSSQNFEPLPQELRDSANIGTSLLVSWQPPRVDSNNGRPDYVGDGGDAVSSYLVEWSRISFDDSNPTIVEISVKTSTGLGGESAMGLLSGSFQLVIDTSISPETVVRGIYASALIPIDSSSSTMRNILENLANVGEVKVYSPDPFTWIITFFSEVGDVEITLAENNVLDESMSTGSVDIQKLGAGSLPSNSAYGFEIIENFDELTFDQSIHYTIQHLVPGMNIYVRVSASNQVGFGPRRKTAPEFVSPALQRPGYPTSLYNSDGRPYLSKHSASSLEVHIGPPSYDGGSPLTTFLIEWDTSSTFSSSFLGDGSAMGFARVNAASQICKSCVTGFTISTNTFSYIGDETTAKLMIPQRKIRVYFSDDGTSYQFSVASATSSTITVSGQHLRVSSLETMYDQNGNLSCDLEIVGTRFIIDRLDTDKNYYVRVSSENGEMGTGKSVGTRPESEAPKGFPLSPSDVSVSIIDKNTISVSWSNATYIDDPSIQAFKVERFCKSTAVSSISFSFFGEKEVVELSSVGLGLVGGTFTLYFGNFETSGVFLGNVKVTNGFDYIHTFQDFTASLQRDESILIGGNQYTVHHTKPFTSSRIPLSKSYSGIDSDHVPIFVRSKSIPVSFDASVGELKNALERMPYVNHVEVRREINTISGGYKWFMTFESNVGPQPEFSVDTANLVGANAVGFLVSRSVIGTFPECYSSFTTTSSGFELHNLWTGKPYYIRVASLSASGQSQLVESVPRYIIPGGAPDPLSLPTVRSLNEKKLLVTFEAPGESNGAQIEEFIVDASKDPSFSLSTRIVAKPDYKIQRVTTRAHSLPWDNESSFTLSLSDFHGDFTVPIGSGTTVSVYNGGNILERTRGSESLASFVVRGDYILVGGFEFRVCLDTLDKFPHDDSHLALCSKNDPYAVANFISDSPFLIIEELPIFRLDTTIGAAKSPTLGDVFLSTIDAFGSSKDSRRRLRRGDLIMVGHPELGEVFRVSTDLNRSFSDRVIPLGFVKEPMTTASLSSKSLIHSAYEVQSFHIRSNTDSLILSPSRIVNSGYRIRFKSETTHVTTDAGTGGCLKWDGSAAALKLELESLNGIDTVKVMKLEVPEILGGLGQGVQYSITFTGNNVRGNVPVLQIVDVGTNGCLDAGDLGEVFKDALAPIVVEQAEISYVPFYEVQTTVDIPHDASAADVKTAIESLSQVSNVNVSRKAIRNGYSWDVTFAESNENTHSPLVVISVNGENLSALVDPSVSAIGLQQVEVAVGSKGASYFIRVAAINSFGMGPFVLSNPRAIAASPQPPSQPVEVFAEAMSDTQILVQWNSPLESGGQPITHYKVEFDKSSTFTGGTKNGSYGSISISSSSLSSVYDVQSITVKIAREGLVNSLYLSGTFSLQYDGQNTRQLSYNASPEDMKVALEDLCNVDKVYVSRSIHCSPSPSEGCMNPDGFTWLVTFVSVHYVGDQQRRLISKLSASHSHKLAVDGSYLLECTDVTQSICVIGGHAQIGTVQEIQQITIASSPFSVTVGGETSDAIELGESTFDIEEKLNSQKVNGVGKIAVTCPDCVNDIIDQGDSMLLHFLSFRGDISLVTVSDPAMSVNEVLRGSSQFVVGRSSYIAEISGLTSLNDWYVRVSAYNGDGEGLPAFAWPSPLRLMFVAPQIPKDIRVSVDSSTTLFLVWNRPSIIGGVQLTNFVIEYDTSFSFTSRNGSPLGHLIITEDDADSSLGVIERAFPNSGDPNLRRRVVIGGTSLVSDGTIKVGSEIVIEDVHFTVTGINDEGCGTACLSLDQDYSGAASSGMKFYEGASAKHYRWIITGLIPGIPYFVRVAAVNERAMSPFAHFGYPLDPLPSIPEGVPSAISWASVTPLTSAKLRVDFGPPLDEKSEGVNGSPVSKYQIDLATGQHEVQELRISSFFALEVGSFSLIILGEETTCIDIGSSAQTLTLALEGLSTIDTVSVSVPSQSAYHMTYSITFQGPTVGFKDQQQIEISHSAICTQQLENIDLSIQTIQNGAESFVPEVIALTTSAADGEVSGLFELSLGYQGTYDLLIAIGTRPAQFTILSGSLWVDTMGDDLTTALHPGETILIGDEFVSVRTVNSNGFELKRYHTAGTGGGAVVGYRMDTYVGSALLAPGNTVLINGNNLESVIKQGDIIEIISDDGTKLFLTIITVTGNSVDFSPSYTGETIRTPVYTRKTVMVTVDSTSAQMKSALELLPDVGSVEVTREGPNPSEGFTWFITFTSNVGIPLCSLPSWCLLSRAESVSYVHVDAPGNDCDGKYLTNTFLNGRPRYDLIEHGCYIVYDGIALEWILFSSSDLMISSNAAPDVVIPTMGWSNGVTLLLSDNIPVALLEGQSAETKTSILQSGNNPSFDVIVFSVDIDAGRHEIQEVELTSLLNDLRGSFRLTLGTSSSNVNVLFDESNDDMATKLHSLSEVGRVHVEQRAHPSRYGRIWTITFVSKSGDIPMLRHLGTSQLKGTGVVLTTRELVKGITGQRHVIVDNLEEGKAYAVRVRAVNGFGYGPYTTSNQIAGGGVHPIARFVSSPPNQPLIPKGVVTPSHSEIMFTEPSSNGSKISSYKFEWSTSISFDSSAKAYTSILCSDQSELLGSYSLIYGANVPSRSKRTVSIEVRSAPDIIIQALNSLEPINVVRVINTRNDLSELQWTISFLYDVSNTGFLTIDAGNLRCQSEKDMVEATVTMLPLVELPSDYGSKELFNDDALCGSVYLAESSSVQYLTLFAKSDVVSGGSYKLTLDNQATQCISFDASESEVEIALRGLDHVTSVHVTRFEAQIGFGFPFSYKISFVGSYAFGDWPVMKIDPMHFGVGSCDAFVGGDNHDGWIVPMRDESLCANGVPKSVAIVADSLTILGGSFTIQHGVYSSPSISFDASASEMESILRDLTGSVNVHVSRHSYRDEDMAVGIAWAVNFARLNTDIKVVDAFVTGKNSRVNVYPLFRLSSYARNADSVGDFRIIVDGESTGPISLKATQQKILCEMHHLNGIAKVNMLGPSDNDSLASLQLNALIDDSFKVNGSKAIAVVGDLTAAIARGDSIVLGSCRDLKISSIMHEDFDDLESAGYLYGSLYPQSSETERAKMDGYSVMIIQDTQPGLSFITDCSQIDGVGEQVFVGSVLFTDRGADHTMIMKSFSANINDVEVIPESNWRGTSARLFFQPPSGRIPNTFVLNDMDNSKNYIIRVAAKNAEGYGPPSKTLQVTASSTVPSAPTSVLLV